jgi:hypothetical protein
VITNYVVVSSSSKNNNNTTVIGVTGTISKSCRKYVSTIPGNHEVKNYRKLPYRALHTYKVLM